MWAAFWANCRHPSMKKGPLNLRIALLNRACRPILDYRCSRWPPQPAIARELDGFQAKLAAVMLRSPRLAGENVVAYCRRRNKAASRLCMQIGRWSTRWNERAFNWNAHIERAHNPFSWPSLLVKFHDETWIETLRVLCNNGCTTTRQQPGRPCARWSETILTLSV